MEQKLNRETPFPYGGTSGTPIMDDEAWQEFERTHPEIPWREPLPARLFTRSKGLACRICIARYGIAGKDVERLPQNKKQHRQHLADVHGEKPD